MNILNLVRRRLLPLGGGLAALLLTLPNTGCISSESEAPTVEQLTPMPDSLFRPGDLIMRLGRAHYSPVMAARLSEVGAYSHVGILAKEEGQWVVLHAEESSEKHFDGGVMEPVEGFFSGAYRVALFRTDLTDQQRADFVSAAKRLVALGLPFDIAFDATDTTSLYCTELVVRALCESGLHDSIVPRCEFWGRRFYGLDELIEATHATRLATVP